MSQQSGIGVAFTGSGSAVPDVALDNQALSQVVETSDDWIASRTGIRQRYLSGADGSLRAIATQAAQKALDMSNVSAAEIDLIILATSTSDDLFAACSGFVFGMVTAAQFIRTGAYRNVLLIGADILSRWVDWTDRRTCVLFGDGAGAVVMQACAEGEGDRLLGFEIRSDGSQNDCLTLAYQAESRELVNGVTVGQGTYQPITMNGQEVYRFAVKRVPEVIEKALYRASLTTDNVNWLLLHQANQRILDAVAQRLGIPHEKVISNMANYGNTSAASIPLALDEAVRQGRVKAGDVIAASGFGAGLTWGAAIFRWGR
jgi:3-oxoacyl-[acyl-carrier-protein] synthase III